MRDDRIDIIRGLAMLSVIAGHAQIPLIKGFCFAYMVPTFFLVSGYCLVFSEHKFLPMQGKDSLNYIGRRVFKLWKVYIGFAIVFTLLHNVFISVGFYTTDNQFQETVKNAFMEGKWGGRIASEYSAIDCFRNIVYSVIFHCKEELLRPLWYIPTSLISFFMTFCLLKLKASIAHVMGGRFGDAVIAVLATVIWSVGCYTHIGLYTSQAMVGAFFMVLGYFLKKHSVDSKKIMNSLFAFVLSGTIVLILSRISTVDMMTNYYTSPFLLLFSSLSGFIFLLNLGGIMNKNTFASRFLKFFGTHTLIILSIHLTSFKIVNLLQCFLYKENKMMIACYPIYKDSLGWTIVYFAVGVIASALICGFSDCIKTYMHNLLKRLKLAR